MRGAAVDPTEWANKKKVCSKAIVEQCVITSFFNRLPWKGQSSFVMNVKMEH